MLKFDAAGSFTITGQPPVTIGASSCADASSVLRTMFHYDAQRPDTEANDQTLSFSPSKRGLGGGVTIKCASNGTYAGFETLCCFDGSHNLAFNGSRFGERIDAFRRRHPSATSSDNPNGGLDMVDGSLCLRLGEEIGLLEVFTCDYFD